MSSRKPDNTRIAKGIGKYLEELDAGASSRAVYLGRGRAPSSDPDEIEAAAEKIAARIAETSSPIARMRLIQRRRDLEAAAAMLREEPAESSEAFFVEYAAAYAERVGIEYGTFRELGVPATVLRDAGIER